MALIFGVRVAVISLRRVVGDCVNVLACRRGNLYPWSVHRLRNRGASTRRVPAAEHKECEGNNRVTDRIDHDALTSL